VALEDVGEVGALGADTKVVENNIALLVAELGAAGLGLLRLGDQVEVLVRLGRFGGAALQLHN
jgi:acyl-CoA thioesterase FadM